MEWKLNLSGFELFNVWQDGLFVPLVHCLTSNNEFISDRESQREMRKLANTRLSDEREIQRNKQINEMQCNAQKTKRRKKYAKRHQ